jgi:glutamate N-acetyltransferase/amino-acid N-acetyltransferase
MMKNTTITSPKGFLAAGMHCGIKRSGKMDIGLIVCPGGANAAAVFTTNRIVSPAVTVCRSHVKSKTVYAVVANSGNANACTGAKGLNNAASMCKQTAKLIKADTGEVLVASTGIIGEQLPIVKIKRGIKTVFGKLSASAKGGGDFAKSIMTTDTVVKQAVQKLNISGADVTIAGTIKGAGMIGPNMATTLCFITTDAAISKALLQKSLKAAVGASLNKLTVDGHQSTNDTAMILASGQAGNRVISSQCPRYRKFAKALTDLCLDLTEQMAKDGEGVSRIFKVVVKNASTVKDAQQAARAIADYDLVKCAVNGGDPNWGRIICAVGSSGVKLNPDKLSCRLDGLYVFKNGAPTKFDVKKAAKIVSQAEHTITVDLGAGKSSDFCIGCDLSREYVTINADYHT